MYLTRLNPKVAIWSIAVLLATPSGGVPIPSHQTKVKVDDYQAFCACLILTSLNDTANALPAQQLLQNISYTISTNDQEKCNSWTEYPDYKIKIFADGSGRPTSNISESVGAFARDIYNFCGSTEIGETLSFPDFSASTAGLLLPWIAIFAQLPRQTGSNYNDLLSIFLSIGSPTWISSSVFLAVLYRRSVGTRFYRLEAKLRSLPTGAVFLHIAERCGAASTILQSLIQAPVRLSSREGFLSSLITLDHGWWVAAAADIKALWRRIDAIFITQTFIAALAWVLAIIADFWSVPGSASSSNSVEWQICMGTLWLWVFPATFGPVAIKSLYKAKAMGGVLIFPRGWHSKLHGQRAIVQRPGLNPNYLGKGCQQSMQYHEIKNKDKEALDNLRIPEMLGLSIEGDGETEGVNTFPYRFFSSEQISNLVIEGFESLNDRLEQNRIPDADQDEMEIFQPGGFNTIRIWNPELPPEGNFKAKSGALDLYLRINVARITAYPEWKEIGRHQWIHLILANILGLVVQWGTTGPAIWVMYWSPPVGLGCDSGGLLIYGVGATLSWLLLTLGSLLSHASMLHYQRYHQARPNQSLLAPHERTRFHTFLCCVAVITRIVGKVIAVINACWIFVWLFLTYTNVMETPYCTTAYFSLGNHGWMRLWSFDPREFISIRVEELRCLVFGSFIAYFACVLIFALTGDDTRTRRRWAVVAALSAGFPVLVLPLYFYGVKSIQNVS